MQKIFQASWPRQHNIYIFPKRRNAYWIEITQFFKHLGYPLYLYDFKAEIKHKCANIGCPPQDHGKLANLTTLLFSLRNRKHPNARKDRCSLNLKWISTNNATTVSKGKVYFYKYSLPRISNPLPHRRKLTNQQYYNRKTTILRSRHFCRGAFDSL